jgi:tRNA (cytidine/uridine-2'-O-)-methyltransferase
MILIWAQTLSHLVGQKTFKMISLALFEPEIPQNTGTLIRLCGCFDLTLHIIEPCGFLWNDKKLNRSVMDYQTLCIVKKHLSFECFLNYINEEQKRLILIDVNGNNSCWDFEYKKNDILLMGKESRGVPKYVHQHCSTSLYIPQKQGRSLNLALAASIVVAEGVRQLTP